MRRGKPPPYTSPLDAFGVSISAPLAPRPRRLRRLDPGAFGACCFAPNLFFVPASLDNSARYQPILIRFARNILRKLPYIFVHLASETVTNKLRQAD